MSHDWHRSEYGPQCAKCGMRAHWPGARDECGGGRKVGRRVRARLGLAEPLSAEEIGNELRAVFDAGAGPPVYVLAEPEGRRDSE